MAFTCFNLILLRNILVELSLNEFIFILKTSKKSIKQKEKRIERGTLILNLLITSQPLYR